MKIELNFTSCESNDCDLIIIGATQADKGQKSLPTQKWPQDYLKIFTNLKSSTLFKGGLSEKFYFHLDNGQSVLVWGLGEKKNFSVETLRKEAAKIYKEIQSTSKKAILNFDTFCPETQFETGLSGLFEGFYMASYRFDLYKSDAKNPNFEQLSIYSSLSKKKIKGQSILNETQIVCQAINTARDFGNEPPSTLTSEVFAQRIQKEMTGVARVKCKVLNKAQIKKENMNLFLAVNAGSAYEPRLVHLTYTPGKATAKTKHIALVGKGLTFDTGGYNLKPSASIATMKMDMCGAATVYAAFKAVVALKPDIKISCFLGMTDNMVDAHATLPDSVIKSRKGLTVEILNTDAEGRLVLADVLDYAQEFKPDQIIDAATLTGGVLVALGTEICGLWSNDQKMTDKLLSCAKQKDEYLWQMPLIKEFKESLKTSHVADLANIPNSASGRMGQSSKAAAFLEYFVPEGVSWCHLDIAGVASDQTHLPYHGKGASGAMIRTLVHYLMEQK